MKTTSAPVLSRTQVSGSYGVGAGGVGGQVGDADQVGVEGEYLIRPSSHPVFGEAEKSHMNTVLAPARETISVTVVMFEGL